MKARVAANYETQFDMCPMGPGGSKELENACIKEVSHGREGSEEWETMMYQTEAPKLIDPGRFANNFR